MRGMIGALWLNRVGLALSFLGSVLVAISFGKLPSSAYQDYKGRRVSLAAFSHPWALYFGLAILSLGFALSLIATWL